MEAHLQQIGGGRAMEKEAVLTKEKLQDMTDQGLTAKEIADRTGKTVGTVNNYKYKWGIKKQSVVDNAAPPDEVKEATVAPDFHAEKERHLKADIERLKAENEELKNSNASRDQVLQTKDQKIHELEQQVQLEKQRRIEAETTSQGTNSDSDKAKVYEQLYEQTAKLLKYHLPG